MSILKMIPNDFFEKHPNLAKAVKETFDVDAFFKNIELQDKFVEYSFQTYMRICIRQSNLIENINDKTSDIALEIAFYYLLTRNKLSEKSICRAHYLLTKTQKGLSKKDRGVYRQVDVMVGNRMCPRPFMAKELMSNWIMDMRDWENKDPKKQHIRFEKIHPFIDGNGRIGRLLMWWHEIMLDRPPTLIYNDQKQDYYKWFS